MLAGLSVGLLFPYIEGNRGVMVHLPHLDNSDHILNKLPLTLASDLRLAIFWISS